MGILVKCFAKSWKGGGVSEEGCFYYRGVGCNRWHYDNGSLYARGTFSVNQDVMNPKYAAIRSKHL